MHVECTSHECDKSRLQYVRARMLLAIVAPRTLALVPLAMQLIKQNCETNRLQQMCLYMQQQMLLLVPACLHAEIKF